MGLVSKDNSKIYADNVSISGSDIAIAAYIKKSEYGPAFIEANHITIKESDLKYFKQKDSVMTVNKTLIPNINCNNIKEICLTLGN